MNNLISLLSSIYDQISNAVFIYDDVDKFIYQNEASKKINIEIHGIVQLPKHPDETIIFDNAEYKISISTFQLLNTELKIVLLSTRPKYNHLSLTQNVKNILLKTSMTDQSFYEKIGSVVNHELQLEHLHILTHDSIKKEPVLKYPTDLTNTNDTKQHNEKQMIAFAKHIIVNNKHQSIYTSQELSVFLDRPFRDVQYLFLPIESKGAITGGIGVLNNSQSVNLIDLQNTLQEIVEYLGLFYRHQHLEESLLLQTSRLNAIFESSSDLIWSVNRTMEVVTFNQNYFRAIFYKYQGGMVTEHHSDNNSNTSPFDEFWETKYQEAFKGNALNFEVELKHPNNAPVWKEIFLMPIYKASGTIDEVSGIAKDISDKKKTVTALHKEEEKFKQIFESFQDLYIRVDLKGKVIMVSPSVSEILGYTVEEIIGQDLADYYLDNPRTKGLFREIIQSNTLRNIDIDLVDKTGTIIPSICNLRIIHNLKGQPIAIESICRDITEIKITNEELISAKNKLETSLKVKEQFLANMSHEIRTPMNGIIGLLDMVLDTKLSNQQTKYLSTIKQSSKLLLNLLNDILDLSKINAGKLNIIYDEFSIKNLIINVQTLFLSELEQKTLKFDIEIKNDAPEFIRSDKLRMLQILSNLISNAIKFTNKSGHIIIKLSLEKSTFLKINVIDNGIGISEQSVNKLFRNFTQINESYAKQYSGAGLGLVISKNLVKLLGGNIGVNSTLGEGSDFWFTIKTKSSSAESANRQNMPKEITEDLSYDLKHKTILVVDDNKTNRLVASEILRKFNAVVEVVENAKEAIEISGNYSYDVILMDIQMPGMDGIQAMNIIKNNNPKQVILAMTAYDEKNKSGEFVKKGFDGYIAKPITPTSLFKAITLVESKIGEKINNQLTSVGLDSIRELSKLIGLKSLQSTFREFEVDLAKHLESSKVAFKSRKYSTVGQCTHSIKGDAATMGLNTLASQAEKIEKNINNSIFSTLEDDLKTLYLMSVDVPVLIKETLNRLSHEQENTNSR